MGELAVAVMVVVSVRVSVSGVVRVSVITGYVSSI